jgi:competence protein ComEA
MLSSGEPTVHTPKDAAANAENADVAPVVDAGGDPRPDDSRLAVAKNSQADANQTARSPLLRRADQAVVAVIVAASLVAVGAYWYMRGGMRGELIEIEADVPETPGAPLKAAYTVDLNTADWPEFEPLPNVGERLARRIVESREIDGPFESVDDLGRIRGVGKKTIERLRPYLRASKRQP